MVLDDFWSRMVEAPDAVAVQDGDRRLTYGELASRASGIAARLAARGVGRDDVVAVYADRSAELVVAELGVLLAGAAYVPLDPAHPAARTAELLALSGAAAVVSTGPLAHRGAPLPADTLVVDLADESTRPFDGQEPSAMPHSAGLVYVIFTSGSTGRPKGVGVSHASLGSLLRWHRGAYRLTPRDRVTLLVSPGFDVSVWDTWATLAAGATLVVPQERVRTSPPDLVAWLADEAITVTFLPTPLAEAVLNEAWPSSSVLRLMHTGGSALQRGVPAGLPFDLVNVYGPAECTVGVTTAVVAPGGPVPPPIGVAVDGVRCYVLDGLDPVPDGEPGEMCLAGACVARGYLGDPAATARSFVPDITAAGERMYRTGDLVRRGPDGVFEYLGRRDDQVKIRGFRIEPGEVAAVLRQHPAVRESFVAAERSGNGDPRLVGYVAGEATPAELLGFAAARLPGYMVPAAVVVLPALPLTPNGKVDRATLPAPGRAAAGLADVAPQRTATEGAVAAIVAGLLGSAAVGADDDFFALGGNSLLVGRLAAKIGAELGAAVSMADLLGARTVAAIAAIVDERAAGSERHGGAGTGAHSASRTPAGPSSSTAPVPPRPPIRPAGRDRPVPLSLQQERVWFFEQLSPGNLAYNFQATVALRGEVDVAALRAALDEIVRRHEILRTAFVAVGGVAVQRPAATAKAPLRVLDVPAEHADKVIAAELRKPFDLTRPPLARWLLLRHGTGENTFVHVEHHFVHDGWSLAVLLGELTVLYSAFAAGQPSPSRGVLGGRPSGPMSRGILGGRPSGPILPELAVQYADYAIWQRDWMRGEVLAAHVDHWATLLAGAPDILELPADHPRPPVMTFKGRAPRVTIPAGLSRALRSFSREHKVSLFTVMYAGFAALLYRYTGQPDLLVGTGAANRAAPELEPLLGMLVNTVVLRTQVSGQMSFTDLLGQAQGTVADALAWSDTPVDAVIDALGPARDASRTPLFQVMFSFHDSAVPDLDFGGLTGVVTERSNDTAKTDLSVIVIPRAAQRIGRAPRPEDDDLTLIWEHSSDLFDEATMAAMITHYLNLLTDAVAAPATQISKLNLLTSAENRQLGTWSRGPEVADPRFVTELIAEQVRRAPDSYAVSDRTLTLTYRELDQRASHFATSLADIGVGAESVVAVYAGRSAHLVVGELAVLMAGGAFLPLDPDYPAHRVSELLAGSGAVALLTTSRLAGNLPPFAGPILLLDGVGQGGHSASRGLSRPGLRHLGLRHTGTPRTLMAQTPTARTPMAPSPRWPRTPRVADPADSLSESFPAVPVRQESLAYVIYTSGSTGRPKGVQATHGGLANVVAWIREAYQLGPGDRSTLIASPTFDGSVWEIWPALTSGGTLLVPPEDIRTVPGDLTSWMVAQRITWAFLPTPLAEAVLDEHWPTGAAMRSLQTGGDAIRRPTPDGLPFAFVNHYGPTETTVIVTETEVPPGGPARPPIGRPLGGARAYVLAGLDPVPVGVPGELCIGGAGVTRGYLGDPAATAAAFVPDPAEPGRRMYRTGDRARWLPDGRIEFLGRMDDQVKIRGYRIEPGEIAATLRLHPRVGDAVVITRDDAAGRPRLIGYAATDAAPEELRAFLAARLPSYMVPDHLIPMTALPWNRNGKVDKAALPAPDTASRGGLAPTRTQTERRLAALWQDLLGVDAVGADDDFFGLGGYSLLVAKMLALVSDEFGRSVPLSTFLAAPTLADLASAIGEAASPRASTDEPDDEFDIDTLSDAEAAAMLAVLTAEGEGA